MDKRLERNGARKVIRRVAKLEVGAGFEHTKPTFLTRVVSPLVQFVHFHKYRGGPSFRVHVGVRPITDPSDAVSLNGPNSHPYTCRGGPGKRRYFLEYGESTESIESCATEIVAWLSDVGEPWFSDWSSAERLVAATYSPLDDSSKQALSGALNRNPIPDQIERTYALLGCGIRTT